MTPSTLEFVFALRESFGDNAQWEMDSISHHSPARVLGWTRFICFGTIPGSLEKPYTDHPDGDNGDCNWLLRRVMRLDDYRRFLKNRVLEFDGIGVYYFLNCHTSPQGACTSGRAYTDNSKEARVASKMVAGAPTTTSW